MRAELVDQVRLLLARAGFAVSEIFRQRPISFDFLARRDDQLTIVKVLTNVDSLSEDVAREMRVLSRFLDGHPLLVGLKASSGTLEAGAVYVRHGIPILSAEGLREYLHEGAPPVAFAAPGGFCVRLDGALLQRLRTERGLSLGQLADVAGVSRRAISMYESGMSATVEAALRLEEFLDEPLIVPLDPLARPDAAGAEAARPDDVAAVQDPFARAILELLARLGMGIVPTARSPFSAIGIVHPDQYDPARDRDAFLVTAAPEADLVRRRSALLSSVSMVSERTAVYITSKEMHVEGATVIQRRQLKTLEGPEGLVDLMRAKKDEKP